MEDNSKTHNSKFITGELSSVDEYGDNEKNRNIFYINKGYSIDNRKIHKVLEY